MRLLLLASRIQFTMSHLPETNRLLSYVKRNLLHETSYLSRTDKMWKKKIMWLSPATNLPSGACHVCV